jgi:hypothetical protein
MLQADTSEPCFEFGSGWFEFLPFCCASKFGNTQETQHGHVRKVVWEYALKLRIYLFVYRLAGTLHFHLVLTSLMHV